MLRSNAKFFAFIFALLDAFLIVAAFLVAFWLRIGPQEHTVQQFLDRYLFLLLAGIPVWNIALRYFGAYSSMRMSSAWQVVRRVFSAALVFAVLQSSVLFLANLDDVSRAVTLAYPLLAGILLVSSRLTVRFVLSAVRRGGYNYRNILLVGATKSSLAYAMRVRANLSWGIRVRGVLLDEGETLPPGWPAFIPVAGKAGELAQILLSEPIDRVVLSLTKESLEQLPNYLAICEELGVEAAFMPPAFDQLQIARIHVEEFLGLPVINYSTTPAQHTQLALKRLMDFVISGVALVLLAPLFLLLALAIKLGSPGPVFFRQHRAGIRGRRFNCYKFRSMYVDAEARLDSLKDKNEMAGPVFKMKNDPRITPVGRFLRKYSFDELPQLFNVLRGDMSLVGPRPPLPAEVAQYEPWQRRRLSMKPGITCIWQVSGRNNIDFEQWMRLDLQYIDNWNLALDFKLLFKTIPAVLRGTGV